jgi:hypothetical protein
MAKGQLRSNKEKKKPKQPKTPSAPASPFAAAQAKPGGGMPGKKR